MSFVWRSSLLSGTVWLALAAGSGCGAQQLPVPVTVHVTARKNVVLRNVSVGVSAGPNEPYSFYKSDAKGDVKIALAPGAHDLRMYVRGYPVTYEHLEVTVAATVTVVLGHGTASKPALAVAATPAVTAARTETATKSETNTGGAAGAPGGTNPLRAYTSCYFSDGLQILSVEPLESGITSRSVDTAAGPQQIDLVAGERVLFAYPFTDYFANVKAEVLPADRYAAQKAALLANLTWLESQPGGPEDAQSLPRNLHGFEVHGNNRQRMEGGVLGMYLLFDDAAHVATTVNFLNQESWRRKFQTMDEYARLRDQFLTTYTGCIRENQAIEAPAAKRRTKRR